jgi:hypothetical protein
MGAFDTYVYLHLSNHRRSHLAVGLWGTNTRGKYDHFFAAFLGISACYQGQFAAWKPDWGNNHIYNATLQSCYRAAA